ncbi:MAG: RICIN domain-containing protein [Tahibacter sp.]
MAFVPSPGSYYYLVAEHSNKVLEVAGASGEQGALIQQNTPKPFLDSYHQQFIFNENGSERIYVLRVRHSQQVIDVEAGSKNDGAKVQQYSWHAVDFQRFRVIDAGDGSFFLEAVHSGKVLDVAQADTGDAKVVVQHANHYNGTNKHQRFRAVLAEAGFDPMQLPTFTNPSQVVRDVTLGIAGLIPEAGGAVKGLVGFLWKDQSSTMIWNQVLRYIESYVESRLEQVRITALSNTVEGARTNLSEFVTLANGAERATKLVATITALNQVDRPFFNRDSAERTLSYFVAIGTIKLTLLQEQARFYAENAGIPNDDNKAAHMVALRRGITEYTVAARHLRDDILKSRVDRIGRTFTVIPVGRSYHDFTSEVTLTDNVDNRQMMLRSNRDGNSDATKDLVFAQRKKVVEAQFGAKLDAILAPSMTWESFDPDKKRPVKQTVSRHVGPWGTLHTDTALAGGHGIAKIELWSDNQLRGIRITNRQGQQQMCGAQKGNSVSIALKAGEVITGVYGSAYYYVHSLFLETSFGQRIGAGEFHRAYRFQADLPPELRAGVVDIHAAGSTVAVDGLRFDFAYELEATPASSLLLALDAPLWAPSVPPPGTPEREPVPDTIADPRPKSVKTAKKAAKSAKAKNPVSKTAAKKAVVKSAKKSVARSAKVDKAGAKKKVPKSKAKSTRR